MYTCFPICDLVTSLDGPAPIKSARGLHIHHFDTIFFFHQTFENGLM